jgi:2-polyprenyl-3-methyl-5-hydroxy-6-metoxy-1,4-benzoquinol methylase
MKRDFDRAAGQWDQKPERVKLAGDVAAAIMQKVPLSTAMDVLDFGCGTGLLTMWLQPHVRSVTGIDTSRGMLDVLDAKIRERGVGNVRTLLWDLDSGGVIPGRFHLVTSSMTFHHVRDIAALLGRFYECLHPGGHVCIADLDPEGGRFHETEVGVFHKGFERSFLGGHMAEAGFHHIADTTASTITKGIDGDARTFSVFLLTAER